MENVLASLSACSSIHIISLLKEQGQQITDYSVEIEGQRKEDPPRTFTGKNIRYIIKGKDVSNDIMRKAVAEAQNNYWSVRTMLKKAVPITSSFEIIRE
jgi:putative redox protein